MTIISQEQKSEKSILTTIGISKGDDIYIRN